MSDPTDPGQGPEQFPTTGAFATGQPAYPAAPPTADPTQQPWQQWAAPGEATPAPPTTTVATGRGAGPKIAAAVGAVVVVGGLGYLGLNVLRGDGGGAETPEAAVVQLLDAVEQEDLIAVMELLPPGERELFLDLTTEITDQGRRLDLLAGEFRLDGFPGITVEFDDVEVTSGDVEELSEDGDGPADGMAHVVVEEGTASLVVDGDALTGSLGGTVEEFADANGASLELDDVETEVDLADSPLNIVVVEQGGRWHPSLFATATAASAPVDDFHLDDPDVVAQGAESPAAVLDALVDAGLGLDPEAALGLLDPAEARYVQAVADDLFGFDDAAGGSEGDGVADLIGAMLGAGESDLETTFDLTFPEVRDTDLGGGVHRVLPLAVQVEGTVTGDVTDFDGETTTLDVTYGGTLNFVEGFSVELTVGGSFENDEQSFEGELTAAVVNAAGATSLTVTSDFTGEGDDAATGSIDISVTAASEGEGDDAVQAIAGDVEVDIEAGSGTLQVSGAADVTIDRELQLEGEVDITAEIQDEFGDSTFEVGLDDGCLTLEGEEDGEPIDEEPFCPAEEFGDFDEETEEAATALQDAAAELLEAFQPIEVGIITVERGGQHFLSPTRTIADMWLAFVRGLEPEDLEEGGAVYDIVTGGADGELAQAFEALFGSLAGGGFEDFEDFEDFEPPVDDEPTDDSGDDPVDDDDFDDAPGSAIPTFPPTGASGPNGELLVDDVVEGTVAAGETATFTLVGIDGDVFIGSQGRDGFDGKLVVIDAATGEELANNDDHFGFDPEVTLTTTAGQVLTVEVRGFGGQAGSFTVYYQEA